MLAEDVQMPVAPVIERKTLPPRVDLAYKVFYGTQGFLIGEATYRFEHADNRYKIGIVGDARGLAALLFRGQGRVESRGVITPEGLQPHELIVDKFNKRGSERAEFDWENGIANLHDNKTAPLELPTFDLLALMWQFYFQPPDTDVQTFALATTKRIYQGHRDAQAHRDDRMGAGPGRDRGLASHQRRRAHRRLRLARAVAAMAAGEGARGDAARHRRGAARLDSRRRGAAVRARASVTPRL